MKGRWNYCRLGDAVEKASSNISLNKILDENGLYPVYGAKGFVQNVSFYHQEEEYIAIIKDGAGIGRVSKHPAKSSVVATMQYLIPKEGYNIDFVKYFLEGINFEKHRNGSTIPHIYFKDYKSERFPNITHSEQQRIVSILDRAFAAIEQAKAHAKENFQNAKELFESYLKGMFEKKGEGWEEKKLGDITNKIGSGATPRGGRNNYKSEGISLVRSLNIHDRLFKYENLAFINETQASLLDNVTLEEDDVLLNITGASVARCAVLPKEVLPARVNQHVSIIRPKKELLNSNFLNLLLTSKPIKEQLLFIGSKGATRQAITKAEIENFIINYPDINTQKDIIIGVQQIQTETQKLETL